MLIVVATMCKRCAHSWEQPNIITFCRSQAVSLLFTDHTGRSCQSWWIL